MNQTKTIHIRYSQAPFFEIRQTSNSDRAYESHSHPSLSIGYIKEGSTLFQLNHESFLLERGALAIIPPYTQHACNPLEKQTRSYVMVYFDSALCLEKQTKLFKTTTTLLPLKMPLIYHDSLYTRFTQIIERLLIRYDQEARHALEQWLEEFLWLYTASEETTPAQTVDTIAFYLNNRFDEPISLKRLASRFEYNPFVLLRHFKEAYGCTPKQYWLNMRIHHAKQLLQNGTPISLCALYCGFVDQSHFHRFFKRHTALTPKEYQVNFIQ